MSSSKRADLQGIRGLAILAVLLFHFFPNHFPNGYIGVDQFFVLSGFLISMILSRSNLSYNGMFNFYYKRVKRIVPMYLLVISFILLSLFVVFPHSNLALNMQSAWHALLFYSNMAETSDQNKYEIELLLAKDAFTHTWSLSVEMQFYLLVPFIFLLGRHRLRNMLLVVVSASLGYHLFTSKNTSFNSVFARLWQFCIGSIVNLMCVNTEKSNHDDLSVLLDDDEEVEEPKTESFGSSPHGFNASYATHKNCMAYVILFVSILQQLYPVAVPSYLLRISTTLTTAVLILIGENLQLRAISNKFCTYLGDISYSLYLVHWPIYTYIKMEYLDSNIALFIGFAASIFIACVLTETYEKFYLNLSGTGITILLFILYSVNFGIIFKQSPISELLNSMAEGKRLEKLFHSQNYKNVSKEDVIKLNNYWIEHDLLDDPGFWFKNCVEREAPDGLHGCDYKDSQNRSGLSMMILGNSYAANMARTLTEECRDTTKFATLTWREGCDILIDRDLPFGNGSMLNCTVLAHHHLDQIKSIRPDVLYLLNRHISLMDLPLSDPNVTLDSMYIEAQKRLEVYQKFVKQRIYILDATQRPALRGAKLVVAGLKTGTMPTAESLKMPISPQSARQRIHALLKTCKKCRLIDLMPTFMKKGEFQMYDPETGLLYYNQGAHFTPRALDLVRPILHDTCHNLLRA